MSIKQFKDIEQFIKKEAEGYEPPFEEEAWKKMEALLDKDNDRKKPFFWFWLLLPVLIVGSIGGYFIFNSGPAGKKTGGDSITANNERSALPSEDQDKFTGPRTDRISGNITAPGTTLNTTPAKAIVAGSDIVSPQLKINSPGKNSFRAPREDRNENGLVKRPDISGQTDSKIKLKVNSPVASEDMEQPLPAKNGVTDNAGGDKQVKTIPAEVQQPKTIESTVSVELSEKIKGPEKTTTSKQKISKLHSSRLYFIAAAGAEGSGVKLLSAHEVTPTGGLAIGYQLSKKWSVQTGFFAGSKKYIAGPGDYNPKAGTYWSTVHITSVKANCMVYEIPLNARYDFKTGKPFKIFASAGLSSYIMKKEDYDYAYNSYGYPHYGKAAYTGNQHLFSVLRVSGGIEKNISGTLSLHAAPAVSVPLGGVGEGQVKLYSTELMVGIRYQPQKKIKNK
jgi:hypothetical protein